MVYNWEIRHHSLVCCCRLADISHIFLLYPKVNFKYNFPLKDLENSMVPQPEGGSTGIK